MKSLDEALEMAKERGLHAVKVSALIGSDVHTVTTRKQTLIIAHLLQNASQQVGQSENDMVVRLMEKTDIAVCRVRGLSRYATFLFLQLLFCPSGFDAYCRSALSYGPSCYVTMYQCFFARRPACRASQSITKMPLPAYNIHAPGALKVTRHGFTSHLPQ
jgi:hypothetical protein